MGVGSTLRWRCVMVEEPYMRCVSHVYSKLNVAKSYIVQVYILSRTRADGPVLRGRESGGKLQLGLASLLASQAFPAKVCPVLRGYRLSSGVARARNHEMKCRSLSMVYMLIPMIRKCLRDMQAIRAK